ncbi:MAG: class I SAM-dependent methyltransferase [Candidatus Omnitrophica bacterium]|nr:class I SAM-dependent methyltransferase [Candidatus Omnitrophota bacterium]
MTNFNESYVGRRDDLLRLVPLSAQKVLDVGCSTGVFGQQIKQKTSAGVTGIELDMSMAKVARDKLDKVIIENIEEIDLNNFFALKYFDCIIFSDVLEHFKNPWSVLKKTTAFLKDDGIVIASIPNVRHISTIISLLFKGYWPYRKRGIHDKNHLRFFTLRNIKEMFFEAGFEVLKIKRKYRIIERPHYLNKFSYFFVVPLLRDFITFQYIVVARKGKV